MADPRWSCAAESSLRGDPLEGTASTAAGWLLIEQRGAWGPDGLPIADLDAERLARLRAQCAALRIRPLLVRQPWSEPTTVRRWFVVGSAGRSGSVVGGTFGHPSELLDLDLAELLRPDGPRPGDASGLLYLVCTHGRHDPCCATEGRAVVRSLRERLGDALWECTHLGGDRFAGNLLLLPHGDYFGRLDGENAVQAVAEIEAGRLPLEHFRGRATLSPFAQAAEIGARRQRGDAALDPVEIASEEEVDRATRLIVVRLHDAELELRVTRWHPEPPALLTCRAAAPKRAFAFRVEVVGEIELDGRVP
ncbi:MAG: sucrase ferredoxin [Acidimicrobiales bacterium]|nr:sucrase ferredoxin [Acidimicrobiales bacterium]